MTTKTDLITKGVSGHHVSRDYRRLPCSSAAIAESWQTEHSYCL